MLNDQGMDEYRKGHYKEAQHFFHDAMIVSQKTYGIQSNEYLIALTNIAYAQQMQADFTHAQQSFREARLLSNQLHHTLHIEHIEATSNLANAFLPSAQYDSCEHYLLIAQQLISKAAHEKSTHYYQQIYRFFDAQINVQNSLASLFYKKGQVKSAVHWMEQQRQEILQTYPHDYKSLTIYHNTINNLCTYYMQLNDVENAKRVVREQVALASVNTKNNLDYLYALNNLGSVYRLAEQFDSAEYVWNNVAHTIIDSGEFVGSDLHIAVLGNLGELRLAVEEYDLALHVLTQSIALQEQRAGLNPRLYQNTLLNLAETYRWSRKLKEADESYTKLTDMLLAEIQHNFTYLSDAEKISFYRSNLSILEFYTSFAFEVSGALSKKPGAYVSNNALKNLFNLALTTKGLILHPGYRLKKSILTGTDHSTRSNYLQWEESKYEYATLARSENPDIDRLQYLTQQIEWLEKTLRSASAEFRKGFVIENKTWRDVQKSLRPDEAAVELIRFADGLVYGALILTSETTDGPAIALIKSTASMHLEKQFYRNYANAITFSSQDTISYRVFWKPIEEVLSRNATKGIKIKRVYFSPDGIYHKINPATLYSTQDKNYLINAYDLRHVTNLKDLVHTDTNSMTGKNISNAVLIGRPAFNIYTEKENINLPDLIGTEKEIDQINTMLLDNGWRTHVYKHTEAQEKTVKKLNTPTLLHIATHGFSNSDRTQDNLIDILLNSGIALAGAGDSVLLNGEDGILTAYEMMNINLDSTQLVVLSACETGLGQFHSGEGIYGLQAALRSAGAETVMISLWKVDDTATQLLMTSFYRHWLQHPKEMRAAFRKAQQDLKLLYPHPQYWGAFILTGK